jgi:hypothetical protein
MVFHHVKDPLSAQYVFSQPVKGAMREAPVNGGKIVPGYLVKVQVNGKNSYGAFVGFWAYTLFFRDNRLVDVIQPIQEL